MSIDTLKQEITTLTDGDWQALLSWVVGEENDRRKAAPIIEEARAEDTEKLWEAHPELKPEAATPDAWAEKGQQPPAWVQPLGAHDSYPAGAVVSHAGRVWENAHPGLNSWEPGAVGVDGRIWRDITDQRTTPKEEGSATPPATDEGTAQGAQPIPWGPGLPVQPGDNITYQGTVYEVIQAHTTQDGWLPDQLPALYKKA